MPLYKDSTAKNFTRILVWKVTESLEELALDTTIKPQNALRMQGMKSELHKRAFLSVRHLLKTAGYSDNDLYYDQFGKPNLTDGKNISITHSHQFAAIIISDEIVGIDLEWAREKILRIANKFAAVEDEYLKEDSVLNQIQKLTVIWGIKEAIFKIRNEPGISFKDHITVPNFTLNSKKAKGYLNFLSLEKSYDINFEIFEEFALVWACNSVQK